MNNFNYYNPTRLIFGKDAVQNLGTAMPQQVSRVLLHYGRDSIKKSGLYDQVINILSKKGIEVFELSGVSPNPHVSLVREGIQMIKDKHIDFILAVGGGSVIDSAKAMAAGVYFDGDVWQMYSEGLFFDKAMPVGVVLTLPATGSESSTGSVITNQETAEKLSIDSETIRPVFAIMDPVYTLTLPKKQTFAGVVDIMSHVLERYFTNTPNVDLTDALCEATLRTVIKNGRILKDNPSDEAARAEIMLSGTLAHNGILGLGREDDWASHRIAHELSAKYDTTHGNSLSIIFPAWITYVTPANPQRFAQFAQKVFHISPENKTPEEMANIGVERLKEFFREIDMPVNFQQEGLPVNALEEMAAQCTSRGTVGGLKKLSKEDVLAIYKLAL